MPDAVLFDFNGVLVDDEHIHLAAFNEVLAPLSVVITDAAYAERYLGFDDRGAFKAALADHGCETPDVLIAELIDQKAGVYARRALTDLRIFPSAASVLRAIAARVPVAIVSGALRSEIHSALDAMGVRDEVAFIVAAEDVAACKPDPAGYLAALDRLRAMGHADHAGGVVALEDSIAGVEAARAAGIGIAAVAHTYAHGLLVEAGAYPVFDTIADVTLEGLGRGCVLPR